MSRHDYLPFGEEVPSNFRTGIPGYATLDNVRQKFTGYEKDAETDLLRPGVGLNGLPRAALNGTGMQAIFVAGESSNKTGKTSANVTFYRLVIIFGAGGRIDTNRSGVATISRQTFLQLGGNRIPKVNGNRCPECLLKRR